MPIYKVKASTEEGRLISKEIEALSREELIFKLEKDGLYPIEVKPKGFSYFFGVPFFKSKGKIKREDFLVFNKGLVSLLKAGLPIVDALETLAHRSPSAYFNGIIKDTLAGVRGGKSLSEAMSICPDVFPSLYTASVSAGERTGDLVPAISGYIEYQKKMETIRKKVVTALTYPAVLTIASLLVVGFLVTYVIPTFSRIYMESQTELPIASRALIGGAVFIRKYAWLFLIIFFSIVMFLRAYIRSGRGKLRLDGVKLDFPQLGNIYRDYAISKFSRTLGMVLSSGIHLVHALEMSKKVLDNAVLEKKADYVIKAAKEGSTVTNALAESGLMPDIALRMFNVGEKSANLPGILSDISDFLDDEVDHRVGIMTDLIEPALMIIMGLIIGTIVVLLYLPIFQLGGRF